MFVNAFSMKQWPETVMITRDVVVIGGGCVGVSVAKHLAEQSDLDISILEKEYHLAQHQTGRNSGIIKPGFNFEPGSLRAELSIEGTKRMKKFHEKHDLPVEEYGVMLLATTGEEVDRLHDLQKDAEDNAVNTRILETSEEIHEYEPHADGKAALYCPEAASVDSQSFLYTLANKARDVGVEFYMGHKVQNVSKRDGKYRIATSNGTFGANYLVNAAGLYADKIADQLGVGHDYQIIPFRGEYYELVPEKADLVKSMIYPTPDPELPFLGVHYTRRVDEKVILGPNAVLAFGREAYNNMSLDLGEFSETLTYSGFWNLMSSKKMVKVALDELKKSYSKSEFIKDAKKLVPAIEEDDFRKSYSGIRSQLVSNDGELVKQPTVVQDDHSTHVLQTAWMTSSLPFGERIAADVLESLDA
jgi:L-2-hydroxyglutarate oxidase LhgO